MFHISFPGCRRTVPEVDTIYVLDSSGSIGEENYDIVRKFVAESVRNISDIGPEGEQVGMIIFGNQPEIVFNLSTFSNQEDLQNAIDDVPYLDENTNTGDALRLMADVGFSEEAGARREFIGSQVAIVITDGRSNRGEPVKNASEYVENVRPPILVLAIGVTDNVNVEELVQIANPDSLVVNIDEFDPTLLRSAQVEFTFARCFTGQWLYCIQCQILGDQRP